MALSSLIMPFIVVVITSTGSSNGYTCGVEDNTALDFVHLGTPNRPTKWKKTELTYVIDNINTLSKQISRAVVAREVARAFKSWSDVTNLSFTRVNSKKADIRISSHGKVYDFNGRTDKALNKCTSEKCVFAHAYKPYDGRLHFNDLVSWTIVDPNKPDRRKADKTDLYTIALHEIGHTLGLDHEQKDKSALMYPKIDKNVRKELSKDDRDGIQALYGKPRGAGAKHCGGGSKARMQECCSRSNQCSFGQGDCDSDSECEGTLVCGRNNCGRKFLWTSADCCTTGTSVRASVSCGNHSASSCAQCPPRSARGTQGGEGYCHGKCHWDALSLTCSSETPRRRGNGYGR